MEPRITIGQLKRYKMIQIYLNSLTYQSRNDNKPETDDNVDYNEEKEEDERNQPSGLTVNSPKVFTLMNLTLRSQLLQTPQSVNLMLIAKITNINHDKIFQD